MTGFLTIFTGPSHRPDFARNPSQSRHGDGAARFERSLWRAGTGWDGFAAAARAATSGKGWTLHDSEGMATLFGDSYAVNGACLTLWPGLRLWQAGNRPGLGRPGTVRALAGRFGGQTCGRIAVFSCHCPVELPGRCWSDGALAGVMVGRHLRALAKLFRGRTGKGTDGLCRSAPFGAAWLEWVSRRQPGREGASRL